MSGLAWGAMVTLGLTAILALPRIVTALELRGVAGDEGDIAAAHDAYSVWTGLHGVIFLITVGVFIAWFFRAYKNLRRLGVQNMRYKPGWAIGAWFIPIFSLFRPKQIANDVWRGSERGVDVSAQWHQVTVPSFVHWWWGLFLLQGLVTETGQQRAETGYNNLMSFGSYDQGLSQIQSGTMIDVVGCVGTIVAAALAIMVVSRVSKRLDEIRGDALGASDSSIGSPPAPAAPEPVA